MKNWNDMDLREKAELVMICKEVAESNYTKAIREWLSKNTTPVNIVGELPTFNEDRKEIVDGYIKWAGISFDGYDRRGLLEVGFREGVKWIQWMASGLKYKG